MGEEATLAHPDRVGQSADREAADPLDRGELPCFPKDRVAAPLAITASPPRGALRLAADIRHTHIDKLARSVVFS